MTGAARSLLRLHADRRGSAAVEFALISPVALAFLGLIVAGAQYQYAYHKTVLAAHTVTDLVAASPFLADASAPDVEDLAQSDLDTDLALSQLVLYGFDASSLAVVVSQVLVNQGAGSGTVVWSEAFNKGQALATGAQVPIDDNVAAGATYVLLGQVSFPYQPLSGLLGLPTLTAKASETLTIRNARQIKVLWGK